MALTALVGPDQAPVSPVDVVLDTLPPDDADDVGVPRLVVEVLSPTTRRRDIEYKTRRYLAAGAREVWLVDPPGRWIEVHTKGCATRHAEGSEATSQAVVGFALVPEVLFARP